MYIFTFILILILLVLDSNKTVKGIKLGIKKMLKQLPVFLNMVILVSVSLYFISDEVILKYLGENSRYGMLLGTIFGSITIMPGFVAFPLAGVLLEKGVGYMSLAAFTTTLMMVGVVSFPVEKEYLGTRVAVIRNLVGLIIAIIISISIGIFYGELI